MTTIATREPDCFTAGDTVQWIKAVTDYLPADGWVLTYTFVMQGQKFQVTAIDNGDGRHLATITAADSAPIKDGHYHWVATVTKALERFTVGHGDVEVLPDLEASPEGRDTRTYAKQLLDAIEATIAGTATTDQASYSFDGVSITRMPMTELLSARDKMRAEVAREVARDRLSKGLGDQSRIFVRL